MLYTWVLELKPQASLEQQPVLLNGQAISPAASQWTVNAYIMMAAPIYQWTRVTVSLTLNMTL